MAPQLQGLLLPCGPTAAPPQRPLRRRWNAPGLSRAKRPGFPTRAPRIKAQEGGLPGRGHGTPRAADVGPPGLLKRAWEGRAIACPSAPPPSLSPRRPPCFTLLDPGAMPVCGQVALLAWAPQPPHREGAPCIDPRQHQRPTPATHDAPIDAEPHGLPGQRGQEPLGLRHALEGWGEPVVAPPPGNAVDPALRLRAVGDLQRDRGPWRPLAPDDAAAQRGEGRQVRGHRAGGLDRIAW
jgi:hypothetical protein